VSYRPRIVDDELLKRLGGTGAVVIEGARACGKTATARNVAASEALLDTDDDMREAVSVNPALVLNGDTPRLIDEWQVAPGIWNHVRRAVDDRQEQGQFILTGSAVPVDDMTRHSGAGRITRLRMRPMSLYELGRSSGEVSLSELLQGKSMDGASTDISIDRIAEDIALGGWPGIQEVGRDEALRTTRGYVEEVARADMSRVDRKRRDPVRVKRLLVSLARNVATHVAATTLAADAGGPDGPLVDDTAREYLDVLERLMVVENQPAWSPHLRFRRQLRHAPKRHFVDPSLAVAALEATPERILRDLRLLGLLFESLVVRDLRIYAQALDGKVLQYRDSKGMEVDAIVEGLDGRWGAFEAKLDPGRIDEGAASLLRFAGKIDTAKTSEPAVLGVIVGGRYGYLRDDGVNVIPIDALGP